MPEMRDHGRRGASPRRARCAALLVGLGLVLGAAGAAPLTELPAQFDDKARTGLEAYARAASPKAFALASDGAWSWSAGELDEETARTAALDSCRRYSRQQCLLFSVDDRPQLERRDWERSWRPYPDAAAAAVASIGTNVGERFPDLAFREPGGHARHLAELRGQVVVLHFWGSWCPPCLREIPELERLTELLDTEPDIGMVMLPVRESFATARDWADRRGFAGLPLFDSGARGEDDGRLRLADGTEVADRTLAAVFPTTYVIDPNGVVVFVRRGPARAWTAYLPFLRDLAERQAGAPQLSAR